MKSNNQRTIVMLAVLLVASSACSVLAPGSASNPAKSAATQTPWIIYVPITNTPEPYTVTPLPTVTVLSAVKLPTRTATRAAAVAATKPPTAAPTKPPVAVGPSPTALPACSASPVTLLFPENGATRVTKTNSIGSDTFKFQWTPFQAGPADSQMGYQISIESRYVGTSRTLNGDTIYISHNDFLKDRGQGGKPGEYIYDARAVHGLVGAGEADVGVSWRVTVVKTTGAFDSQGHVTGSVVNCSTPSATWTISLKVVG